MVEKDDVEFTILRKDPKYYDYTVKVILVGDSAVGKTCLVWRGVHGEFKDRYDVTVGSEFSTYVCSVNGRVMKMQVWDTCGQEAQRSLARIFYKGSNCVVLVYDITRPETFEHLDNWLRDVKDVVRPDTLLFLVGNMADEEHRRQVTRATVDKLIAKEEIAYYAETSAKTGLGVNDLFAHVARALYRQRQAPPPKTKGKVKAKTKAKPNPKVTGKEAKEHKEIKEAKEAKEAKEFKEVKDSTIHRLRRGPRRKKRKDECCP